MIPTFRKSMSTPTVRLNSNNSFVLDQFYLSNLFVDQFGSTPSSNLGKLITSSSQFQTVPGFDPSNKLIGFQVEDGASEITLSLPLTDGSGRREVTINVLEYNPELPIRTVDYFYDYSSNSINIPSGVTVDIYDSLSPETDGIGRNAISAGDTFDGLIRLNVADSYDPQDGSLLTYTNFVSLDGRLSFTVDSFTPTTSFESFSGVVVNEGSSFANDSYQFTYDVVDSDGNVFETRTFSINGKPNVSSVEFSEIPPAATFANQSTITIPYGTVTYTDVTGGTLTQDVRYDLGVLQSNGTKVLLGSDAFQDSYGVSVEYDDINRVAIYTLDNASALTVPTEQFYFVL